MAIFDSEKRPRGLRVPSLTAMKNGVAVSKSQLSLHSLKKDSKTPEEEVVPAMPSVPAPPPQRAPPPNKELPPPPKDQKPPPPKVLTKVPARRAVPNNAKSPAVTQSPVTFPPTPTPSPPQTQAPAQTPTQPQPQPQLQSKPVSAVPAASPAASPAAASPQTQVHVPLPSRPSVNQPAAPTEQPTVVVSNTREPSLPAVPVSPPAEDSDATPLEDFIPTPEGPGSPVEPMAEEQSSQLILPEVKPVAAPLNKVHFACFQEHRNMPVAQNVWCPLPCQTCNKFDTEIRHRCVFCSLRICESCYKTLQKCQRRSLNELLEKLS